MSVTAEDDRADAASAKRTTPAAASNRRLMMNLQWCESVLNWRSVRWRLLVRRGLKDRGALRRVARLQPAPRLVKRRSRATREDVAHEFKTVGAREPLRPVQVTIRGQSEHVAAGTLVRQSHSGVSCRLGGRHGRPDVKGQREQQHPGADVEELAGHGGPPA